MPNYRRAWVPGATWFFTVNLLERRGNDLLVREIHQERGQVHFLVSTIDLAGRCAGRTLAKRWVLASTMARKSSRP